MPPPTPHAGDASTAIRFPVTFSETDGLGAVHHRSAVVWFERAREAFFTAAGTPAHQLFAKGWYLAVRELWVKYESFVSYGHELEVRVALTKLGRVNLDLAYRVDNLTTGQLALRGRTNLVAVEPRPGSPVPVLGRIQFDRAPFQARVVPEHELYGEPPPGTSEN